MGLQPGVAPHSACAASVPAPSGRRAASQTLSMLRMTAHELRSGASPAAALIHLAQFMRRVQPSQLRAISHSGVVEALVARLGALAVPVDPEPPQAGSIGERQPPPELTLQEPKLVAIGLSALANLLYVGGHKQVCRAGACKLLARLLYFSNAEVQSYVLASCQNLSSAGTFASLLLREPTLLGHLREIAVLMPDGDPRFYFAAGCLANLVKMSHRDSAPSGWLGVCGRESAGGVDRLALRAADAEMTVIIQRRAQIKLTRTAIRVQASIRATQQRKFFTKMRAATVIIQAGARGMPERRELARARAAAVKIQRLAVIRFQPCAAPVAVAFDTSPASSGSVLLLGCVPGSSANKDMLQHGLECVPKTPGLDAEGVRSRPSTNRWLRGVLLSVNGQEANEPSRRRGTSSAFSTSFAATRTGGIDFDDIFSGGGTPTLARAR
ncbi:hypothetical protein T492DRAFT_1090486 [Pavlovales sp. CCMP2436]|nr:hypothetical protein T492DRAFT_1090486 [Pavlovales sp. CCMP2436]